MKKRLNKLSISHFKAEDIKNCLTGSGILALFFCLIELVFAIMQGNMIASKFFISVLFSVADGVIIGSLLTLLPAVARMVLHGIVMLATTAWCIAQVCYYGRFQTYLTLAELSLGKQAAEEFTEDFKTAITEKIPQIIILIIVFGLFLAATIFLLSNKKRRVFVPLAGFATGIAVYFLIVGGIALFAGGSHSLYSDYSAHPGIVDNNVNNFGLVVSFRLNVEDRIVAGFSGGTTNRFEDTDMNLLLNPSVTDTPTPTFTPTPTNTPTPTPDPRAGEPDYTPAPTSTPTNTPIPTNTPTPTPHPQIVPIDFDMVAKASETNENSNAKAVADLNAYVKGASYSYTNDYTGFFKDKNLIMICGESFTDKFINETLTPTLYMMSHNGFVFNNFYGTFKAVTTNGEYAFTTGLMPLTEGTREELKHNTMFEMSASRYMPYTLANALKAEGASAFGYHGNNGNTYNRNLTHPNVGYNFMRFRDYLLLDGVTYKDRKLTYSDNMRPTSDTETALQSVEDYLSRRDENGNVERFVAYYMTYSGHHPYYDIYVDSDTLNNPRCWNDRDIVDPLDCLPKVKSFISANLEVEHMVTALIEKLTEAGCLEDTVIVLTNDHYPYGLSNKEFQDLARVCGNEIDKTKAGSLNFGSYKNSFICYCAGMEPVIVDTPCCTVDIVPTLLNLFGVEYDSRLLGGTDVLDPKSFHIAMLFDKCFVTNMVKYDSSTHKVTYLVDKSTVPNGYVDACISYVNNKFETSLKIVQNDYYRLVYGK